MIIIYFKVSWQAKRKYVSSSSSANAQGGKEKPNHILRWRGYVTHYGNPRQNRRKQFCSLFSAIMLFSVAHFVCGMLTDWVVTT